MILYSWNSLTFTAYGFIPRLPFCFLIYGIKYPTSKAKTRIVGQGLQVVTLSYHLRSTNHTMKWEKLHQLQTWRCRHLSFPPLKKNWSTDRNSSQYGSVTGQSTLSRLHVLVGKRDTSSTNNSLQPIAKRSSRMNQLDYLEMITAILQHAGLKTEFWTNGLQTVVCIINLSPSSPSNYKYHRHYGRNKCQIRTDYASSDVRYMYSCRRGNVKSWTAIKEMHFSHTWDQRMVRILTMSFDIMNNCL